MKRRTFLKNSTLTAFSVATVGSIHWNGKSFVGDNITTTDILGPFYRPGAPMRSDLIPAGSTGEVLHLSGTVFQKDGKTPIENVLIEAWQCDENENYDNTSDDYLFRGAIKSDKNGNYNFKTIVPVPYKASPTAWRPAHIHLRVSSPSHQDLITQIYFKGDAHLAADRSSASPRSANRILEITKNTAGVKVVNFNIVMADTFPLSDEGYNKLCGLYALDRDGNAEFYRQDDLLFIKFNGQVLDGLTYKGNNLFQGGLGHLQTQFELSADGSVKAKITSKGRASVETWEGAKFLKY
jgi:catechol 1,2-dioxygenase